MKKDTKYYFGGYDFHESELDAIEEAEMVGKDPNNIVKYVNGKRVD